MLTWYSCHVNTLTVVQINKSTLKHLISMKLYGDLLLECDGIGIS